MSSPLFTEQQVIAAGETVGVSLNSAQAQGVLAYMSGLAKWNKVYNLTAIRDDHEVWTHHVMDCLAVIQPIRERYPTLSHTLDVGSGGGLPGIVLAIAGVSKRVSCIDAVAKKVAFINQMSATLQGLPTELDGIHCRVEKWRGSYDLITSRAFASLPDFVAWTRHLLAEGGVWMAMKGKMPDQEMSQLPADVEVFHVEQLTVPGLDEDRCLIWLRPR